MLRPSFTGQFKKDLKRVIKRGWDVAHLERVMRRLAAEDRLETRYREHPLKGEYSGFRECHIGLDFLLIWYTTDTDIVFVRTGSHADLFE